MLFIWIKKKKIRRIAFHHNAAREVFRTWGSFGGFSIHMSIYSCFKFVFVLFCFVGVFLGGERLLFVRGFFCLFVCLFCFVLVWFFLFFCCCFFGGGGVGGGGLGERFYFVSVFVVVVVLVLV